MRAALVISSLGPGGAERVLSTMANYWAAKGWKIDLLTLDGTDKPPFYRLHDAVAHHPLGLYGQSRRPLEAIQRNRQRARALRDSLRRAAPQIVISFGDRTNVLTLLAAAGLRVPVIVSERADPRHWDIGLGWEMLRRWLYPRAARIVLLSAEVRCYFSATVQRKSRVIPNPVVVPEGTAPGSKLHSPSPNHQEPGARSRE